LYWIVLSFKNCLCFTFIIRKEFMNLRSRWGVTFSRGKHVFRFFFFVFHELIDFRVCNQVHIALQVVYRMELRLPRAKLYLTNLINWLHFSFRFRWSVCWQTYSNEFSFLVCMLGISWWKISPWIFHLQIINLSWS